LPTLLLVVLVVGCGGDDEERSSPPPRTRETAPRTDDASKLARTDGPPRLETVATGLEIP
jgi:hypothetical protein